MLLMYNKVNAWLPLKAVPPNRQEVLDLFHFYDKDDSNTLTFEEFRWAAASHSIITGISVHQQVSPSASQPLC